ncbi:molybdopterin-dependent oxidoreductase [Phycicoccus sp. CSK15P-2]|uniref:molybdopterin oxidoreductase family protein n=1 Tax=Phycicoccus sp. CSK15P-2 TaxID=2807627 RepID=UPI001950B0EC|nr:molybdopterin-dependent oxidoreductase [Phycicoccus sp. CSK15P-2]MBM6404978.1 molybdopterin-dependent oxidoreductase [Phycicoccus sp. CSK15P-2]
MTLSPDRATVGPRDGGPTATHCPYCALQCAQQLVRAEGPVPVEVQARDFPTNRGGMCQKGWSAAEVLTAPDRLTTPLVRRDGELVPATWDEALDLVHARLEGIRDEHGPEAVAVFGGGGLTNEKAYTLGKLARVVLRTPYIDYNGRFCMSSAAAAANRTLGVDRGLAFPVTDLGGAEAVLLVGSNPAETMPPLVQHLAGARSHGGLVVVDPRRSATARLTEHGAGTHLAPVPGSDLVVLLALTHVLVDEALVDADYLAERTTGWEDVLATVSRWWPERAEAVCGVPADTLRRTARRLAAAAPVHGGGGAFVLTGRGMEQSAHGTDTVSAAITLALALGLPGRRGSGYGPLTGQGNGQGGREHGLKSDQLPGYRLIADPAAREHVAGVWGVDPGSLPGPGVPAVELLARLGTEGGPRALLVHGANVVVSAPNVGRVREALGRLDLLVVSDVVPSETARMADVVLPVAQWAEEEGTMTNLEGRVVRRRRATDPPGDARDELWVLSELARRFGHDLSADAREVFDELARASAGGKADYSGITYDRLDAGEALYWPCPADRPAGTPRMFEHGFATADGRARLVAVDHRDPADDVTGDRPLFLTTGRVLHHYQSGAQTRRVAELVDAAPEPFAELSPLLADTLGVAEGDLVRVVSARGALELRARVTSAIRPDTVFVPFHWAGALSANLLTSDATDPVSGMPEFKVCAVSVERVAARNARPVLEEVHA